MTKKKLILVLVVNIIFGTMYIVGLSLMDFW